MLLSGLQPARPEHEVLQGGARIPHFHKHARGRLCFGRKHACYQSALRDVVSFTAQSHRAHWPPLTGSGFAPSHRSTAKGCGGHCTLLPSPAMQRFCLPANCHRPTIPVKTRGAFKDRRVEPSGKVTAANSYPKHNPTHYNQTNRRALTKLCLGQAAQNKLSSCGCKAVLQAPGFTSFSLVSLEPHRPATAPSLQLLKHSLLRHFKVAQKPPKQTVPDWSQS